MPSQSDRDKTLHFGGSSAGLGLGSVKVLLFAFFFDRRVIRIILFTTVALISKALVAT